MQEWWASEPGRVLVPVGQGLVLVWMDRWSHAGAGPGWTGDSRLGHSCHAGASTGLSLQLH